MKRAFLILLTIFLFGCPPPSYVNFFNNTLSPVYLILMGKEVEVLPLQSIVVNAPEVFVSEQRKSGFTDTIIRVKTVDKILQFGNFEYPSSDYLKRRGNVITISLQLNGDGTIFVVKHGQERPVSTYYSQPDGFPMQGAVYVPKKF